MEKETVLVLLITGIISLLLLVGAMNESIDKHVWTRNLDMNGSYILNMPFDTWIHHDFGVGATDEEIIAVHAGDDTQDKHYRELEVSLDAGPGAGKTVYVHIHSNGNEMILEFTGDETHKHTTIGSFDWDASENDFTVHYGQTAGGSSSTGIIRMIWWYIENQ